MLPQQFEYLFSGAQVYLECPRKAVLHESCQPVSVFLDTQDDQVVNIVIQIGAISP